MNVIFSAEFEADTLEDVQKTALTLYQQFVDKEVEELPYNSTARVLCVGSTHRVEFSVSARVEE